MSQSRPTTWEWGGVPASAAPEGHSEYGYKTAGSMAHTTTREYSYVMFLVGAAIGDHMGVQGMCITVLTPYWMQAAGAAQ